MLSEESQRVLSELLMRIIESENKIEILRKCLCENIDFSPQLLFKSLSKVYPDAILPKDLKEFLYENSIEASDQEVYLLVRQYSSMQNGRLTNEDFFHFVVTSTDDSLGQLVMQRYHIREIRPGVKYSFLSLLKEEVKLQREEEELKVKLFQNSEFSLWKAFETLNRAGKGYVCESDVLEFLKKFGRFATADDFDALMRRIDIEDDFVISYNEFLEAMIPLTVPKHSNKPEKEEIEVEKPEKVVISEPIDSEGPVMAEDLEKSPRFRESAEFSKPEEFETPEKPQGAEKKPNFLQQVSEIITLQLDDERMLEYTRQNLVMQENFSISQLFALIDLEGNSQISPYDFQVFLDSINLQVPKNVLVSIFKKFCESENLTFSPIEILKIFTPQDPEYKDFVKEQSDDPLLQATIEKVRDVLEVLLLAEEKIQGYQEVIAGVSDEEIKEVFAFIDADDDGEISSEDLRSFFKKQGRNISEKDRKRIIEKYTQNQSSIFFNEFKKLIAIE